MMNPIRNIAAVVGALVVVAGVDGCHILLQQAACQTDADCPTSLPVCNAATGFCAANGGGAEGEGEGEGDVGEGEGSVGEGEGAVGEGEGEGSVGEGEGSGGEGEGEGGGLPLCATTLDSSCDPSCKDASGKNIDPDCVCPGACNNTVPVGDFVFTTDQSGNQMTGCVQGNVTIKNGGSMPPNLRGVIGDFTIESTTLSTLDLVSFGCVGGTYTIAQNPSMNNIVQNATLTLGGDLIVDANPKLTNVPFPFGQTGGGVRVTNNHAMQTLNFPQSFTANGDIVISDNAHLGNLQSIGATTVNGNVVVTRNPLLASLPQTAPVNVHGTLNIDDNASLNPPKASTLISQWPNQGSDNSDNGECINPPAPPGNPFTGNNNGHGHALVGSCGGVNFEDVFTVTAAASGQMIASVSTSNSQLNLVVYLRSTCGDIDTELACANANGNGGGETAAAPVAAGQTVFVVVDTDGAIGGGQYTLNVIVN